MRELTTHERMTRMFEHREADRVPVHDSPWGSTVERWHREGMPAGAHFGDFFGLDDIQAVGVDNSPRYPTKTIEQTDDYTIFTTGWGATLKQWRHIGGVPEFLDFTVVDRAAWADAKARMTPSPDRLPLEHLKSAYRSWRENGAWVQAGFWFGFDITHSWFVGTERLLMALIEDPEWCVDMWQTELELNIALFDTLIGMGYTFDCISWPDDMGYKHSQFFSVGMYRELLKPVHKRACDWAHSRGIKVHLHSCGDVNPLVPELIDIGIDMLNPLEVKAGMDPASLKAAYGDRLAFHGGLNAVLYGEPEELWAEMRRVVPVMKANGGYVISSDHSVPETVSLAQFGEFVRLAKELGSYD